MGRKEHKLTTEEREDFEQVVHLKNDIIDKILTLKSNERSRKCERFCDSFL